MAQSSTKRVTVDLRAAIKARGGAVRVAAAARVGYATIYRAMQGTVPGAVQLWAIATVLGVTEDTLRAAILASAKGAA